MQKLIGRYGPKWLRRLYADFYGYFWIPCPICRQMFGGFEWGEPVYERTFYLTAKACDGGGAICNACGEKLKAGEFVLIGAWRFDYHPRPLWIGDYENIRIENNAVYGTGECGILIDPASVIVTHVEGNIITDVHEQ